jgi:hypothetical protein
MNNKRPLTLRPAGNAPFEGHYFVYAGRRRVGRIYRCRGWRPEAWFWGLSGDLVKDGQPHVVPTGLRANEGADY